MKGPRFAAITITLDTSRFAAIRPAQRDGQIAYLLNRLLSGEVVAESEFVYFGMKVTARDAVSGEIFKPEWPQGRSR